MLKSLRRRVALWLCPELTPKPLLQWVDHLDMTHTSSSSNGGNYAINWTRP